MNEEDGKRKQKKLQEEGDRSKKLERARSRKQKNEWERSEVERKTRKLAD